MRSIITATAGGFFAGFNVAILTVSDRLDRLPYAGLANGIGIIVAVLFLLYARRLRSQGQ